MTDLLLAAIFQENLALSFFLGVCTFLAVSQRFETALGLGVAVIVVQTLTVPLNSLIFHGLLVEGAWAFIGLPEMDLTYLKLIAFIGIIAAFVQILEMTLDRYAPVLYNALGVFLPAHHRQLCNPRRQPVHGGTAIRLHRSRRLWFWQRLWLGTCHRRLRRHSRTAEIQQHSRRPQGSWHRVHCDRADVARLFRLRWSRAMISILFGTMLIVAIVLALTMMVMIARQLLMPAHPAVLTVNGTELFDVRTGQSLLAALHDHDVLVPSACAGAGTCGLCRVSVSADGPSHRPVEITRLTAAERKAGVRLACQVTLRDDLAVEAPQDWIGATTYPCTVQSVTPLTPLIREIVLQVPDTVDLEVVAGSYIQVTAPPYTLDYASIDVPAPHKDAWRPLRALSATSSTEVTRAYSISNRPEDTRARRLVLNIRLALPPPSVPDAQPGIVSSWLFGLEAGQTVETSGPFGTFRAQRTDREMVFIGGGVGMAPLRALIHEQLGVAGSGRTMSFWYGARSRAELFYVDELNALASQHDTFSWTAALSDPSPDDRWDGPVGFVHKVAFERYLREHPAPENCEYYLCGPPLMIRAVFQMLDDLGVDRDHIFNDDFGV